MAPSVSWTRKIIQPTGAKITGPLSLGYQEWGILIIIHSMSRPIEVVQPKDIVWLQFLKTVFSSEKQKKHVYFMFIFLKKQKKH